MSLCLQNLKEKEGESDPVRRSGRKSKQKTFGIDFEMDEPKSKKARKDPDPEPQPDPDPPLPVPPGEPGQVPVQIQIRIHNLQRNYTGTRIQNIGEIQFYRRIIVSAFLFS